MVPLLSLVVLCFGELERLVGQQPVAAVGKLESRAREQVEQVDCMPGSVADFVVADLVGIAAAVELGVVTP